jgi:predicted ATPase/class 3 adenylate cyclase
VTEATLPTGTVTFLFTDVEGSTRLLHEIGAKAYAAALAEHRDILRETFTAHGGVEVDTQGDAFFVAFPTAPGAVEATAEACARLREGPIRIRAGIHTGTPLLTDAGYVGVDVHRAARIAAAGTGGQVLVSAATASLVDAGELRDLGEHRLKDLSAPERIFQLGKGDFPPLRSLYRTNLPVPSTPFVGRERELEAVMTLLSHPDVRLLTLTGPGGTGKTRLALQAAGLSADDYPDGVWWVALASLRDPQLVLEAAAQAVGGEEGLAASIGSKHLLLLFDNFEHVLEAAGGLAELLESCAGVSLLVTSREPLHLSGEHEYPVPPFAPDEGIGFFVARAHAHDPDVEPSAAVGDICRRLDDLPLALELAAARVKSLTPEQILQRLDARLPLLTGGARDLPERQRTLAATIAWSYELLSDSERRLFAGLSVFSGGCTLEAAEAICSADLDDLQSIVDKSLVRHTGERFWMLETIREYAAERLRESGRETPLQRAHAEYFVEFAEEADRQIEGPAEADAIARLSGEQPNFRKALQWAADGDENELVLRLAAALALFWQIRGLTAEGRRWLRVALA